VNGESRVDAITEGGKEGGWDHALCEEKQLFHVSQIVKN
jgi:hypothetical protein